MRGKNTLKQHNEKRTTLHHRSRAYSKSDEFIAILLTYLLGFWCGNYLRLYICVVVFAFVIFFFTLCVVRKTFEMAVCVMMMHGSLKWAISSICCVSSFFFRLCRSRSLVIHFVETFFNEWKGKQR